MATTQSSLTRAALAGKQVLITGTTGFLGKVLLEKIIRDIPEVGGVTLIVRGSKKYPDALERCRAEIFTSSVFERLQESNPQTLKRFFDEKITCVSGEITEPFFGLSEDVFTALALKTDVLVNSAASVNFHEPLDQALKINAYCLENAAKFSRAGGNVPVIQVSTCYVNGKNNGIIREEVYGPASTRVMRDSDGFYDIDSIFADLEQRIAQVKGRGLDAETLSEALTELGLAEANRYGWGDTYTFTKWLGEQVILRRMKGQTLTIVRPSVVESCLQEPVAGWIEGVKVTDAILLAYAREKVSFFPARKAGVVDIIPVDLVSNSLCLSMAEALSNPGSSRIYQCCSGSQNPLNVKRYVYTVCEEVRQNWAKYPKLCRKQPQRKFRLMNKHLFVAGIKMLKAVLSAASLLSGRSASTSRAVRMLESTLKLTGIYATYTSPRYVFNSDQLMALAERMGERDKALFPVDAALIDWDHYFCDIHVAGLNHYGMETRALAPIPAEVIPEGAEPAELNEGAVA